MRHFVVCVWLMLWVIPALGNVAPAIAATPRTPPKQLLATGNNHTCVVHTGTIWCWGEGSPGQLGDQTFRAKSSAVQVKLDDQPLSSITSVSAGGDHTCALQSGRVYCWGGNAYGQIGIGHTMRAQEPTLSSYQSGAPLQGIKQISAGYYHTCAITARDTVLCWGHNDGGQLGDNSTTDRYTAVPVRTQSGNILSGVTALSSGYSYTCAIATQIVYCWGSNLYGQLGDGTTNARAYAAPVKKLDGTDFNLVTSISAGRHHACAITTGNVFCWGSNSIGQLGDATTDSRTNPVQVINADTTPLTAITRISAASEHSCATTAARVVCWGNNDKGQLGNQSTVNSLSPVTVMRNATTPLANPTAINAGLAHTCVISDTSVWCWGDNERGQLGDGSITERLVAVASRYQGSQPLLNVTKLVGGQSTTCALRAGQLFCWGSNRWGQFQTTAFDASDGARLVTIKHNGQPLTNIRDVKINNQHACVLSNGRVYCWGDNGNGQLGDGTTTSSTEAVLVRRQQDNEPLTGVTAIAIGPMHSCALSSGTVYCWGYNFYGQLGDNSNTNRELAVPVQYQDGTLMTDATLVDTKGYHSCALRQQQIYCWGSNTSNNLGDMTSVDRTYAAPVVKLGNFAFTNITTFSAGFHHGCAIQQQRVWCWGSNTSDLLGNGEYYSSSVPGAVPTKLWRYKPLTTISAIMANSSHTCAQRNDTMLCWGDNTHGQIGDLSTTDRNFAVYVRNADGTILTKIKSIFVGNQHACAIVDKQVKCWGDNGSGELGNNNRHAKSAAPVTVLMYFGKPITGIR